MNLSEPKPFQVNLTAVVELLSRNIYSHPSVYLRELIQNARDAITMRQEAGLLKSDQGRILITPSSKDHQELTVQDNGIGMQRAEMAQLLATVGQSSKRDIFDLPRQDRLGQFGIGLLSCFMVADEIIVDTKSAISGEQSRWIGKADGTFTIDSIPQNDILAEPGTIVRLTPRGSEAELTRFAEVWDLSVKFAQFLPVLVEIAPPIEGTLDIDRYQRYVNRSPFHNLDLAVKLDGSAVDTKLSGEVEETLQYAIDDEASRLMDFGQELIGQRPLAVINLDVPATATKGSAFVLPYAPAPGSKQQSRAYLGGLLVSENLDDLLPDWAFFVRAVIDSNALTPTAAREGFVNDEAWKLTKKEIAKQLKSWILNLAQDDPMALQVFINIHDLALRSLASHDFELAATILPHLTFESNHGRKVLSEVVASDQSITYCLDNDEFKQIAALTSGDKTILNAGYVYEKGLMAMARKVYPDIQIREIRIEEVIDNFAEVPPAEAPKAHKFLQAVEAALAVDADFAIRSFEPSSVAALYVVDPKLMKAIELRRLEESAGGFWQELISSIAKEHEAEIIAPQKIATLVINWASPIIQQLQESHDEVIVSRIMRLIYVQSILAGQHSLRPADTKLLNESLADMLSLSVSMLNQEISISDFIDPKDSQP